MELAGLACVGVSYELVGEAFGDDIFDYSYVVAGSGDAGLAPREVFFVFLFVVVGAPRVAFAADAVFYIDFFFVCPEHKL